MGGSLSASRRAAAWAEVTTSASVTGAPMPSSRAATAAGVREALLVTYATWAPACLAFCRASGAPGIGGAADVDDAVEVEEEDVVGFGERSWARPYA